MVKPKIYKDWYIFPDTVFNNFNVFNCSLSADKGVCPNVKNIDECIDICSNNPNCVYGMYMEENNYPLSPNYNSKCLPINHIHKNANLSSDLLNTHTIPELKDKNIYTFINKNYFPDVYNNALRFDDICHLHNEETDTNLYTSDTKIFEDSVTVDRIIFDNIRYSHLRLISTNSLIRPLNAFVLIKYGEGFFLNIKDTNFILRMNDYGNMTWVLRGDLLLEEYDEIKLMPLEKNRKIGDKIAYGDKFYIVYGNTSILCVNRKGVLIGINDDYESLVRDKYNPTFTFISDMKGYYCEDNKCKTLNIRDLEPKILQGKYKTKNGEYKDVYINPKCHHLCKNDNILWYIAILVLISIAIITIVVIKILI